MEKINREKSNKKFLNKSSLLKIGNFIKEERLKRNESINELAAELKISVQQFKAIEEGQDDLLPEKVFVKAMIKRISEKLKLDTDFLLGEFNNQTKDLNIEEVVDEVKKEKEMIRQSKNGISYFFITAIFVSGMIGLLASSIVLNIFSTTDNNSVNKEFLKKD